MAYVKDFTFDPAHGFTGSAKRTRKFADGGSTDRGATDSGSYDDMPDAPFMPWDSQGNALIGEKRTDTVAVSEKTGKRTETQGPREPLYGRPIPRSQFWHGAKGGRAKKPNW
jgi:hypothetical protein